MNLNNHLPVGGVGDLAQHLFNEQREVKLILRHVGQRRLLHANTASTYTINDRQISHSNLKYLQKRIWVSNTYTSLTALFPGLSGSAGTRKVKPVRILLKQEIVSGSGISWAICKSAPCSRQITTPAPHHSVFLQAGCPSCHPTNSVKALKAPLKWIRKQISELGCTTCQA